MMTGKEIIFRIRRNQRIGFLLLAIVIPLGMIGMMVFFKSPSMTLAEYIGELFSTGFGWYLIFSMLLITGMMTYAALQTWHDQLIFTDTQLERRGIPHPRTYKGPTPYEDIVWVRRGSFGVLILETSQGKKYIIAPKPFEGGASSILAQLRAHIAQDRFEENLEERLYKRSKLDKAAVVVGVVAIFMVIAGSFYDDVFERLRRDVAWHVEVKTSFLERIESYALSSEDGSLWILVRKRLADYGDPSGYEVRRLKGEDVEILSIPSMGVLYPDGAPEIGFTFPNAISLTEEGLPRLYFDSFQPELIWNGAAWAWGPQPDPRETDVEWLARTTGDPYWETLNEHGRILVKDTKAGVETEVDLGPSSDPYRVVYEGKSEGWTIVRMNAGQRRYFLMRFKAPDEPKIWVEIEHAALPLSDMWRLVDCKVDSDGVFFVLLRNIPYCVEGVATHFVGKLDPSGGDWVWRSLQHRDRCDGPEGNRQLLIDMRGRLWLTGEEVVAAFEPGVFEKEGIEETDYVLYSPYNSGYYRSRYLRVGPDERIWTSDIHEEVLVWIDADVDQLERPLPDWIHRTLSSSQFEFVANFGGLILLIAAMLMIYAPMMLGVLKGGKKRE